MVAQLPCERSFWNVIKNPIKVSVSTYSTCVGAMRILLFQPIDAHRNIDVFIWGLAIPKWVGDPLLWPGENKRSSCSPRSPGRSPHSRRAHPRSWSRQMAPRYTHREQSSQSVVSPGPDWPMGAGLGPVTGMSTSFSKGTDKSGCFPVTRAIAQKLSSADCQIFSHFTCPIQWCKALVLNNDWQWLLTEHINHTLNKQLTALLITLWNSGLCKIWNHTKKTRHQSVHCYLSPLHFIQVHPENVSIYRYN